MTGGPTTEAPRRHVAAPDSPTRDIPTRVTASRWGWLAAAMAVAAAAAVASVALGARIVPLGDVVAALGGADDSIAQAAVLRRIPRTALALLVGGALGLSGAVMQGVTRNPLADPGILGVTTGAALAAVVGLAFFGITDPLTTIWIAIAGATVTAVAVYAIDRKSVV